jgi:CO/xanthine dehydrogenase FAD-binding subunit
MKPAPFDYRAPSDLHEVLSLLRRHGADARVLAGGQSLVPQLNRRLVRPKLLVDIGRLPEGRTVRPTEGEIEISFAVTQAQLLRDRRLDSSHRLWPLALKQVGHLQTRNRGTVVGSVAHADPAAEVPAVLVALDGSIELRSAARGMRRLAISDFLCGPGRTAIVDDELAVAVCARGLRAGEQATLLEVGRRDGTPATAGVVAIAGMASSRQLRTVTLVGFGALPRPTRLRHAERAVLDGDTQLDRAIATDVPEPYGDRFAPAQLRRGQLTTLVRRAVDDLSNGTAVTQTGQA